jgi:hypothetical protein
VGSVSAPVRTAEGQAELATRGRRLSQRHRTLLFIVDGRRSAEQIRQLGEQAGVPESCYGELLEMGLIELPPPVPTVPASLPMMSASTSADEAEHDGTLHIDLPLSVPALAEAARDESVLPAAQPLQAESTLQGDLGPAEPWQAAEMPHAEAIDPALDEARDMLLRAVRAEAPVAGSLTLMRLRRAATRAELEALLDECEGRLRKPHRMLATTLLMRRVRQLIGASESSPMSAA